MPDVRLRGAVLSRGRGRPRRPAELRGHNCLGYTLASSDGWRFAGGTVAVEGSLRASNGDALVAAAAAGLGLIYQPTFLVADALRRGSLVALDLGPIPSLPLHAVMPSRRNPPAKVRALVAFVAARFADPPWDRDLPAPLGVDAPLPGEAPAPLPGEAPAPIDGPYRPAEVDA